MQHDETGISNEIRPDESVGWSIGQFVDCQIVWLTTALPDEVVGTGESGRVRSVLVAEPLDRVCGLEPANKLQIVIGTPSRDRRCGSKPGQSRHAGTSILPHPNQ